jgi:U6 snRNA-associated Sm-like protein LSm7
VGGKVCLLSQHTVEFLKKNEADGYDWPVTGTLKGYDALMNLVLDDVDEVVRDDEGNTSTRPLGLVVARGTLLVLVSPVDGSEEIANPFVQAEE